LASNNEILVESVTLPEESRDQTIFLPRLALNGFVYLQCNAYHCAAETIPLFYYDFTNKDFQRITNINSTERIEGMVVGNYSDALMWTDNDVFVVDLEKGTTILIDHQDNADWE